MNLSSASKSAGDFLGGLKDRFTKKGSSRDFQEDEYYDEAFDYGDYGYVDDQDFVEYDDYAYSPDYDEAALSSRRLSQSPRLVSTRDVEQTTSVYGVSPVDRQTARSYSTPSRISALNNEKSTSTNNARPSRYDEALSSITGGLNYNSDQSNTRYNDFVSPYSRDKNTLEASQEDAAIPSMPSTGSAGLDGLFAPSVEKTSSYSSLAGVNKSRELIIVEPNSFEDAAQIAVALRRGDAVVLNLKRVESDLAKRVLDFSFGVVAALAAQISYEQNQVFVLTQQGSLTLVEKDSLRRQRILD